MQRQRDDRFGGQRDLQEAVPDFRSAEGLGDDGVRAVERVVFADVGCREHASAHAFRAEAVQAHFDRLRLLQIDIGQREIAGLSTFRIRAIARSIRALFVYDLRI